MNTRRKAQEFPTVAMIQNLGVLTAKSFLIRPSWLRIVENVEFLVYASLTTKRRIIA